MKSFTVTYHHTCNYGATLQTYALQQFLMSRGIENEVMEYEDAPHGKKNKARSLKALLKQIAVRLLNIPRKRKKEALKKAFADFHRDHIVCSRVYKNVEDLRNDPPDADLLITGSDQVWNLKTNPGMIPARFLDFGKKDAVRISYAASIGPLNYTDEQKEMVREYLTGFKAISLREKSASEYISTVIGRKCDAVADPVFLLSKDDWNRIAKPRKVCDGPYILCYFVQGNPRIDDVVRKAKAETGYKVVSVNCDMVSRVRADIQLFDVSPQEFLALYNDAAFVITTSFHGTAFSLIYEKPFYALTRENGDFRIKDLLAEVGADEYIVSSENLPSINTDAGETRYLFKLYRERSVKYIEKALAYNEAVNKN